MAHRSLLFVSEFIRFDFAWRRCITAAAKPLNLASEFFIASACFVATVHYAPFAFISSARHGLRQIAKIRQDSIDDIGRVREILALNPGLLGRLVDRAQDNLAAVYIFKSCDGGATWTTTTGVSSTCLSGFTRNVDNGQLSFPWRPVTIVNYTIKNKGPDTLKVQ